MYSKTLIHRTRRSRAGRESSVTLGLTAGRSILHEAGYVMESLVSVLVVFQQPRRPRSKEHPVLEAIGNARRDPVPTSDFQGLRDSPSDEAGTSGTEQSSDSQRTVPGLQVGAWQKPMRQALL